LFAALSRTCSKAALRFQQRLYAFWESLNNGSFFNNKYAQYLKSDLCLILGFCSIGDKFDEIQPGWPFEISTLIDEVFKVEGLNPELADNGILRQVRKQIVSVQQDF